MSVLFNANGEYLSQTDITSSLNYNEPYTLMTWYYPVAINAASNFGFLWFTNSGITTYDAIGQESVSNGSSLYVVNSGGGISYSAAISAGSWYHVAMVRRGSTLHQGYLNGVQFGSNLTDNVAARGAAGRTYIGNPNGSAFISARFAHIKIFRAALTPEEIQSEMQQVSPATNAQSVLSWWPMTPENRKMNFGQPYSWTENGTLSDDVDPGIAWTLAKPRPMVWWIPPPATTSAIPSMMQSYRQRRG